MNMNKYFSFAIVALLMAVPVVKMTSWMTLNVFNRN